MNILYLTNNPNLSSTSRILQYWLEMAPDYGVTCTVLVQKKGELSKWLQNRKVPYRVNSMPWPSKTNVMQTFLKPLQVYFWLKAKNVDIVHCNEHDVFPFTFILGKYLRAIKVCHVRYRIGIEFARWCFSGSRAPDFLLWTSQTQKQDSSEAVRDLIPEKNQQILHLGIDLLQFGGRSESGSIFRQQYGISKYDFLIATASPLRPRKRIEDFIFMIERVAALNSNIVGIIAGSEIEGDEQYRKHIEQMIREAGLGPRLRWIGNLEPVEPLHAACDISISTSEYETFGNSVCEAMACSKPVVAYEGGSVAEVLGDTGIVVPTGDLEGLIRGVQKLIDHPEFRISLGRMARQRVQEKFNPRKSFEKLLGIYQDLLAQKKVKSSSNG